MVVGPEYLVAGNRDRSRIQRRLYGAEGRFLGHVVGAGRQVHEPVPPVRIGNSRPVGHDVANGVQVDRHPREAWFVVRPFPIDIEVFKLESMDRALDRNPVAERQLRIDHKSHRFLDFHVGNRMDRDQFVPELAGIIEEILAQTF